MGGLLQLQQSTVLGQHLDVFCWLDAAIREPETHKKKYFIMAATMTAPAKAVSKHCIHKHFKTRVLQTSPGQTSPTHKREELPKHKGAYRPLRKNVNKLSKLLCWLHAIHVESVIVLRHHTPCTPSPHCGMHNEPGTPECVPFLKQ